jgi:hypothetical protein
MERRGAKIPSRPYERKAWRMLVGGFAALGALTVLWFAASAAGSDGGVPPSQASVDRTSSQSASIDGVCKAHVACRRICIGCDVLYPTYDACIAAHRPSSGNSGRPVRPTVSADDFKRCMAAISAASKTQASCTALIDQEWPVDCNEFIAQSGAKDYREDSASRPCGPGYVRDGAICRLTCQSDADCRPNYEACSAINVCEPAVARTEKCGSLTFRSTPGGAHCVDAGTEAGTPPSGPPSNPPAKR